MKRLVFGFVALFAISAAGYAGTEAYSGPSQEYKQVQGASSFSDQEWQVDTFGSYQVGNGPDHAGPIRDHAWGGGVAVNYFFLRYFGLSAEGTWLEGHDNQGHENEGRFAGRFRDRFDERFFEQHYNSQSTQFQSVTGSLIFRWPIEAWSMAPYVFTGGGATMDGSAWAVYHIGVGLEYRLIPNKLGIFADGRWNYYGDRNGHDTQNNFLFRTGARLVF